MSHIQYATLLWGSSSQRNLERVFKTQMKAVRCLLGMNPFDSCREAFRTLGLLTVPCLYIYECILYVKNQKFMRNSDVHSYYTRFRDRVNAVQHNTSLFKKNPSYMGDQFIKTLPTHVSNCESKNQFRRLLKGYLIEHSFYGVDDFLSL